MKSRANGMSRNGYVAQMGYRAKKCRENDVNPYGRDDYRYLWYIAEHFDYDAI